MYTVTFYSFKGGVGRSLALANVGLGLARTGRTVLIVDFDLEAPGIDTFGLLRPKEEGPGIIEYVSQYISSGKAPDVRDYTYEVFGLGKGGGRLWVMPAGRKGKEYSAKLGQINWQRVYEDYDGFLMVEDIKAQWEKSIKPDYVLIDSRTGYTDTGGICTRQLPDSVVVLFFPNEQNLAGLKQIISEIRSESNSIKGREIYLHFVMSNFPDLDDENEILAKLRGKFQDELRFRKLSCEIHRYNSLSLLNQSLFVVERPKSRLAREYEKLLEKITEQNIEDREAVFRTLRNHKISHFRAKDVREQTKEEDRIGNILKYHNRDGELLYELAKELKRRGRVERAESVLKQSLDLGYQSPEAYLEQAKVLQEEGNKEEATRAVLKSFEYENVNPELIANGIAILRRVDRSKLAGVANLPAFRSLRYLDCIWLLDELNWCREGLEVLAQLLVRFIEDKSLISEEAENTKSSLFIALIGLSKFEEGMKLFGSVRPAPEDLGMQDSFNYAMAEWGAKRIPPKDIFERVVDLDTKLSTVNYCQCLSIALWVVGKVSEATKRLQQAREQLSEQPTSDFSCWRYLQVTPSELLEDCESIECLIGGGDIVPLFFSQHDNQ